MVGWRERRRRRRRGRGKGGGGGGGKRSKGKKEEKEKGRAEEMKELVFIIPRLGDKNRFTQEMFHSFKTNI